MRIKKKDDFPVSRWDGGTTTELFLYPESGSYIERNFQVRLSSAVIEKEESDFTLLPGVHRFLLMQKGSVRLRFGNGREIQLPPLNVFEFDGDVPVHCFGSGTDLNLMLKGGARGELACRTIPPKTEVQLPKGSSTGRSVYVIEGSINASGKTPCSPRHTDPVYPGLPVRRGELILTDREETLYLSNLEAIPAVIAVFSFTI